MSQENIKPINIIYIDENFKKYPESIIKDCQEIKNRTKGTLILIKNFDHFKDFLKLISITNPNSKFVLIMNGSSSQRVIAHIKSSNYMKFFVKACIYCKSEDKYKNIQEANKDLVGGISSDLNKIISFVISNFNNLNNIEFLDCNVIINLFSYDSDYFSFHQSISKYYANEMINESKFNPNSIKNQNDLSINIIDKIFKFYIMFKYKTNEEFIFNYLKEKNVSNLVNQILKRKEKSDFEQISYFVGNLMHRIVEYGRKEKKGINSGAQLYKGMKLDTINLFEYIKNEGFVISFSNFISITSKKELAELNSERNIPLNNRKSKNLFSVMITFNYLHDEGFTPSIFDLSELIPYPDEEEFIALPFTFFHLVKVKIDKSKMNVDIEMTVIGKFGFLEERVRMGKKVYFNEKKFIMESI